jgi:hypothetical protein
MASSASLGRMAIVAVALLLLWRIIHVNVGLYDASGQPRQDTRASLGDVIDDNPAEIAALVMLAKDREAAGDIAGASKAYRVAIDLAPLDREVLALASSHFLRQDDMVGLPLLGRLMTSYPESRKQAFAALAGLLALNRYQVAVGAMAASDPPWLAPFVADACRRGTDPALLAPLVLKVSSSGTAAHAAAACVVDKLRAAGKWEQAYHLWLNLLPRTLRGKLGFVFNGGFELPPGPAGFDWILQQGRERATGHEAAIARAMGAEGQRALRVAYNGNRQSGLPIRQYLVLQPGRYELTGMVRLEAVKAARGINWTVRCMEGDKPRRIVARSERFQGSSPWQRFAMDVEIDGSCSGHGLQLEPVGEDGALAFVGGTAWFDDIFLQRR